MKKIRLFLIIFLVIVSTTFINFLVYNNYYNSKIIDIVNQIAYQNKDIEINKLAYIIKNPKEINDNKLKDYGYDKNDLYLVGDIKLRIVINLIINLFILYIVFTIYIFINNKKKKSKINEINDLIVLLENINKGNYDIELDKFKENDFSKLRNEIYKTTGLLKEQTEYLKKEKISLKNNLADISHQIRTPLTSISLMLESIIDDKNMSDEKKDEFINIIYKQTDKINYLIENLLKLSKFDASVIEFKKEKVNVNKLINNVKYNLKHIIDFKNINFNIKCNKDLFIDCDKKWQEEALTNIVKNSLEYSNINSNLDIEVTNNNFYTMITIKDYGSGISKEELKKIFIRFHKSNNSSGVGIGLNLAKTIIEKDGGIISVESKKNEYTIFTIKYMK